MYSTMIEASKAVVRYVRTTSTPAVCCAATEQLGSHPKGENSLKNPQEIRNSERRAWFDKHPRRAAK